MESHIVRIAEKASDIDGDTIVLDREFALGIEPYRVVAQINADADAEPEKSHKAAPGSDDVHEDDEDQDSFDEGVVERVPRDLWVLGERNAKKSKGRQSQDRLYLRRDDRCIPFCSQLRRQIDKQCGQSEIEGCRR